MHTAPVRCVPARHRASDPAVPADLAAWRSRHTARQVAQRAAVSRAAAAPVRYVPEAFLEALQGSWGHLEPVEAAALVLARRVSR